ncbi:MAG: hypothetical protein LBV12_06975 [Puniceicoccales bacterium]|nr:hypothetical protein [Puniceicoccales bacterium]
MVATFPVLSAQEKTVTPADDFLKNLPQEIKLQKTTVIPRQQITAFEKKLGGKISRMSNSVIMVDGKTLQINAILGSDDAAAKTIHAKIVELGSPAPVFAPARQVGYRVLWHGKNIGPGIGPQDLQVAGILREFRG